MNRLIPRIALLATVALTAVACTPFESLWRKPAKPAEVPAAPAAVVPELPLAEATHRFVVAPDDDVVGQLQVTLSRDEDTFADIARRFNIGYAELLRANPGVDPWLPGEGTQIVLPTEFVLPDAPREGLVLNLASMRLYYYPAREKGAPVEVIRIRSASARSAGRHPRAARKWSRA
jgi:L,D-transpeptidase ErfK/SrfK